MRICFKQSNRAAILNLTVNEKEFGRSFSADGKEGLVTMAWNAGPDQWIKIDEVQFKYPSQTILPLVANQKTKAVELPPLRKAIKNIASLSGLEKSRQKAA